MSRFKRPRITEVADCETPDALSQPTMPTDVGHAIQVCKPNAVLRVLEDRDRGVTLRRWEVTVFARSSAFEEDRTIRFDSTSEVRDGDEPGEVSAEFALEVIAVIACAIEEAGDA